MIYRGSRILANFTCNKAIDLQIHWPFYKLHCNFVIIWWPESENHWPGALGHCILEDLWYISCREPIKKETNTNEYAFALDALNQI